MVQGALYLIALIWGASSFGAESNLFKVNNTESLYERLSNTPPYSVIEIAPGYYHLNRELRVGIRGVTLRGHSTDTVTLDFSNQKIGAQGMLIRGWDISLQNFTVKNTAGDGIVVRNSASITLSKLKVDMGAPGLTSNGAYGLYPVRSRDVTIENCIVSGATDAGIYLGQSINATISGNIAFGNVAGINIENSINVKIDGNVLVDNTVGTFIVSLPDMIYQKTKDIIFSGNSLQNNNRANFSMKGNTVNSIKPGSGLILVATDTVSVRGNEAIGHESHDFIVANYAYLNQPPHGGLFDPRIANTKMFSQKNKVSLYWDGVYNPDSDSQPYCVYEPFKFELAKGSRHLEDILCKPLTDTGSEERTN